MNKEEIEKLKEAFRHNSNEGAYGWNEQTQVFTRMAVGFIATMVDYLRGDIEGLPSPLPDLARSTSNSSHPNPQNQPADNGDPAPIATEVMKRLGSLGVQSLSELKGYKYDAYNHILLHINGRFADSGWEEGDPHMCELENIMEDYGLSFQPLG